MKPVLEQARQIIEEGIMVRKGEVITANLASERARNITTALIGLLCDPNDSRASIVSGEIRSRYYFDAPKPGDEDLKPIAGRVARHLEDAEETAEQHAERVIK